MSYRNPDTDGVACIIAMVKILSDVNEKWIPNIQGVIGEETKFVLETLEIPFPDVDLPLEEANKIALVDTHHKEQLPTEFPYDKVVVVIDHHSNGDDELFRFANIINRKIGAAASIVAELYLLVGGDDNSILKLLACGILSNTLNFSAPSTTSYDKQVFEWINTKCSIDIKLMEGMFEKRSMILTQNAYVALLADFKMFNTKKGRIGISQIEAYNLEELIDTLQYVAALKKIADEKGIEVCLFNGVDIKRKRSVVIAPNEPSQELVCTIFRLKEHKEVQIFNRILLRKTDFILQLNE